MLAARGLPVWLLGALVVLGGCARGPAATDFTLTDAYARPWSLSAQRGRPVVLTFGFTHCADTCPATLAKLARLTDALGPAGRNVRIVMVSVDPQRDTPQALRAFTARFERPVAGLTGTQAQVDAVETAYHVWAQRVPGRHGTGEYDMAHSGAMYFIDAGGRIRSVAEDDDGDAVLARALHELTG